ncbi:MAG: GNAT family N-acetyltransferase [Caldilineaceae bacterium]
MMTIERVTAIQVESLLETQLIPLLQNVVDDGASIGFIAPLSTDEARDYWQGVLPPLQAGHKVMFIARLDDQIIGSVQLALEPRANGRHRGEVQKLMVHTAARGQGIARRLMAAIEAAAREHQRTLLVLDTVRDGVADKLYPRLGYTKVGTIPRYALSSAGPLEDTVLYYREL